MNPNPFDQDEVIRILLEEADIPTLKTLRELNSNWNSLDLKELENRAKEGEFRGYNFSWGHRGNQKTLEEAKDELAQFLDATQAIPQLFRDFRLHFPQSLKHLKSSFFSQYPPMFICLDIHSSISFNEDNIKLLMNFLNWVAPTIKELYLISFIEGIHTSWWKPEDFSEFLEIAQYPLNFPKLNKFNMDRYLSQFRVILDKGGEMNPSPNLNQLRIGHLNNDFGELLGLGRRSKVGYQRWSTLTRLSLCIDLDRQDVNLDVSEITRHLCSLSQYGMTLNYLSLNLSAKYNDLSHLSRICGILGQFLESQSSSLQNLVLHFSFQPSTSFNNIPEQDFEEFETLIRLPIFPNLLKLNLGFLILDLNERRRIPLQMGSISSHFPKLTTLEFLSSPLIRDFFERVNLKPWSVRKIIFFDNPHEEYFDWLKANFCSVVSFECVRYMSNNGLESLPWADTLEHLCIHFVRSPLKLAHLTHLKHLVISDFIPDSVSVYRESVHAYLEHFEGILELNNLTKITFQTDKEVCDEVKCHIKSYFPFEVEFKSSGSKGFF